METSLILIGSILGLSILAHLLPKGSSGGGNYTPRPPKSKDGHERAVKFLEKNKGKDCYTGSI